MNRVIHVNYSALLPQIILDFDYQIFGCHLWSLPFKIRMFHQFWLEQEVMASFVHQCFLTIFCDSLCLLKTDFRLSRYCVKWITQVSLTCLSVFVSPVAACLNHACKLLSGTAWSLQISFSAREFHPPCSQLFIFVGIVPQLLLWRFLIKYFFKPSHAKCNVLIKNDRLRF